MNMKPFLWNQGNLQAAIAQRFSDHRLVVVSNRQPYVHHLREGKIICQHAISGVVTGLEPVVKACSGLWVAHGDGTADRKVSGERGIIDVPLTTPAFQLKRLFLSKEDFGGYYYGFSNEVLWPLCHIAFVRPTFRTDDWEAYQKVNAIYAEAILSELRGERAIVFIQDYHLALVSSYLKQARPDLVVAQFWHIPWPTAEIFRICRMREDLLKGLLGNDLLGFHLRYHADNFLMTCDREIDSHTDQDRTTVIRNKHRTRVKPFPISVDFEAISKDSRSPQVCEIAEAFRSEWSLDREFTLISLDRIDYTKGIPEKLMAISRFLEKYPEYHRRFVFVQVGIPSRTHISHYRVINDEIDELVESINWKYSSDDWEPVRFIRRSLAYEEVLAFYQLGDVCVVSSLHDGMNLIAKEYVSSRNNLDGVLILSRFTGAARELDGALFVNPYDPESFADQIKAALELDAVEKQRRMAQMREQVAENNIYKWAGLIVTELAKLSEI
ncbi:MAG: trehalose-6-phosphate synthase [Acidobacteria bacterium]|nr:trehalose-6-phosphate synthase [Acidobacteriota bacterium]